MFQSVRWQTNNCWSQSTFGSYLNANTARRYLPVAALAGSAAARALLAAMSALRFSAIWRCVSANGANGPLTVLIGGSAQHIGWKRGTDLPRNTEQPDEGGHCSRGRGHRP